MTEKNIKSNIEKFKVEHIKWIEDCLLEDGSLTPVICILALDPKLDEMGLVVAPILGTFTESNKHQVIEEFIPELFDEMKTRKLVPYCFSMSSEVYIRTADIDKSKNQRENIDFMKKNLDKMDKTEGLLITFETEENSSTKLYNMERVGKAINKKGEMVDDIKLSPFNKDDEAQPIEGRFVNIFKKYKNA